MLTNFGDSQKPDTFIETIDAFSIESLTFNLMNISTCTGAYYCIESSDYILCFCMGTYRKPNKR